MAGGRLFVFGVSPLQRATSEVTAKDAMEKSGVAKAAFDGNVLRWQSTRPHQFGRACDAEFVRVIKDMDSRRKK